MAQMDFDGGPDLREWLKSQPREVSVAIAARAAQRAVIVAFPSLDAGASNHRSAILLPTFRAMAAPWVAAKYPTQGAKLAAAYAAADAAAAAAAAADADAAAAALAADAAASDPATAASDLCDRRLFSTGTGEMYAQWNAFARELADRKEVKNPHTGATRLDWKQEGERRNGEAWHVWTDWIDDRIKGKPGIEALEVERALIPNKDWEKGPHHVNHLIARMQREHFAAQKMLPEMVERNPETWRYRSVPDAPTKPDSYEDILDRVRDALGDLQGDDRSNQYTALDQILSTLTRQMARKSAAKQTMHDEFISAYRGALDLMHSGEVPRDYSVRRFCDALRNGYTDIANGEPDVKAVVTARAEANIRAPNAEVAEELAAVIDRKAHASDPGLAQELRADDAELRGFDDAEEDEGVRDSATAAAHRLASRAPKIDEEAVERDGKSSFGKVVDASETAGKLHKGAEAVGTSWKWLDYLTSLFG